MTKDKNFTTCVNEWETIISKEQKKHNFSNQIPVFSFPDDLKPLNQLVSGYMCGASCTIGGKTYEARTRRSDTLAEIAEEFEKTPVYLHSITKVPTRETYAIDETTFEPLNEKSMTPEYYMVRYAEV